MAQQQQQPLCERVPSHPDKLNDNIAVWSEMKDLAVKYNCLSLGEGAPNLMPPQFLIDEMVAAMNAGHNQYTRTFGVPALVNKVAEVYGPKLGRTIDPMKEIIVTQGANGSLMAFINAYCNKGQNVVCFEPMFPLYLDHTEFAGGKVTGVPLTLSGSTWQFDPEQLRAALSVSETTVMVMNTPHNPTGKVFTRQEIEQISDILDDFPNVLVISDEPYDFLTFDGLSHVCFATVGNNWGRTISVYSAGKLLNATGWKVGWAIGPQSLIYNGGIVANTVFYCFNTPGQVAVANSLDKIEVPDYNEAGETFVQSTRSLFQSNRDYIKKACEEMDIPWQPVTPEGGYFLMADVTNCRDLIPEKYLQTHDYEPEDGSKPVGKYRLAMPDGKIPLDLAFCRWMAVEKGVCMMPNSFFYHPTSPTICENYVRLAICKDKASTEAAVERLKSVSI